MYGLISADREWGSGKEQRSYNMSGGPSLAPHLRTGEPALVHLCKHCARDFYNASDNQSDKYLLCIARFKKTLILQRPSASVIF